MYVYVCAHHVFPSFTSHTNSRRVCCLCKELVLTNFAAYFACSSFDSQTIQLTLYVRHLKNTVYSVKRPLNLWTYVDSHLFLKV